MAAFTGAIFDMDGTLLDSMKEWRKQNVAFCERHGVPVPEELLGKELDTSSHAAAKLYERLYPHLGMDYNAVIEEYEACLDPLYRTIVRPTNGVKSFLEMLKDKGVRMCVATATPADIARRALEHHGIAKYMEFVVSTGEVGMSKSSQEYFPRVARMLGMEPDDAAVFEDALYAVRSAKSAGMRVYAVEDWCARGDWEEIRAIADVFRKDFTELYPIVEAALRSDRVCSMRL